MSDTVAGEVVSAASDDLDAAYAAIRKAPYTFTWASQEWSLPHLGALDYRLQMEIENYAELGVAELMDLFDRLFGPEQAARWTQTEVPTPVLFMLFKRWIEFCGGKLGEEPASNDSSANTGESSRPISGASTTAASPKRSTAKKAAPRKAASRRGSS